MVLEYGMNATIFERWLCRYNRSKRYPCSIGKCTNKLRNGRCGLAMCRLEIDDENNLTGQCLDLALIESEAAPTTGQ